MVADPLAAGPGADWPTTSPRAPATRAPGSGRSPSATTPRDRRAWSTGSTRPRGAPHGCSRPSSRRNCGRRLAGRRPRGASTGPVGRWPTGWRAKLGRPVQVQRGWDYSAAAQAQPPGAAAAACPGRPRAASGVQKKLRPLVSAVADGLPAGDRRTVGDRRAPHRAQAAAAPGLGADRPAARPPSCSTASPGAISSALSIPPPVARSSTWRPLSASRSSKSSWPPSRSQVGASPQQADRPRPRPRRLAHQPPAARARACPSALPAAVFARTAARRAPLAADQRRAGQPPFRQHRGARRQPNSPTAPPCSASPTHPLHIRSTTRFHWWPTADPQTSRTQTELI